MLRFATVLFFCAFSTAQILSKTRPEPELHVGLTSQCCDSINNPGLLTRCINNTLPLNNSNVALVTFAEGGTGKFGVDDIMQYATYMLAVTSIYAEHHGYSFKWMSTATGSNFQPDDMRWNKIRILIDALNPLDGWARDVRYIVSKHSNCFYLLLFS